MITPGDLIVRNRVLDAVRAFFRGRGYLAVETPVLLPVLIPERWIEPVACGGGFLQTSPEICMKRLLARGHARIFQICRCFRNGERGRLHLPEFSMLEWYRSGADYRGLMSESEDLVRSVLSSAAGFSGSLPDPFPRITVERAFSLYAGVSADEAVAAGEFERLLVERVEPALAEMGAVFLHDYPAELASLARLAPDGRVAERFELYVSGVELVNGFSELADPDEQRQRFAAELEICGGMMPDRFLDDLAGMGEAAGAALGIDRLVMLALGADRIDRAVAVTPEEL